MLKTQSTLYALLTVRNRLMPALLHELVFTGFTDNGQHQLEVSNGSFSATPNTAQCLPQRRRSQSGVTLSYNCRRDVQCPTSRSGSSHSYRLHCWANKASGAAPDAAAFSTITIQRRVLPSSCRATAGGRASHRVIALSRVSGE